MTEYNQMTQEEFVEILGEIVTSSSASLLSIPGIYEILSEEYNNAVLKIWAS